MLYDGLHGGLQETREEGRLCVGALGFFVVPSGERKCSLRNFLQDMFEVWLDGGPVPILAQGPPVLDLFFLL